MPKLLLFSYSPLSTWLVSPGKGWLLSCCLLLSLLVSACTITSVAPPRSSTSATTPIAPGTTVTTTTTVVTQTTTTITGGAGITGTVALTPATNLTAPLTNTGAVSGTAAPVVLPTPTLPPPTPILTTTAVLTTNGNLTSAAGGVTSTSLLTNTPAISATVPVTNATVNIVQLVSAMPGLETLAAGLTSSGMASALQGSGPFTLFAPTDDAFNALSPEQLEALLNNPSVLVGVLQYHLVIDEVISSELASLGVALSSTGQPITVTVQTDGALTVNGARIVQGDIRAANGIVHIIDQVLIPPTQ